MKQAEWETRTIEGAEIGLDSVHAWLLDAPSPMLFIEPLPEVFGDWRAAVTWLATNLPSIEALTIRHGGIVLRGFPLSSSDDFADFVDLLGPYAGDYAGGASARETVTRKVMEATKLSAEIRIPLHQEMAYLAQGPGRITFYARLAARTGGETIVADMRALTHRLPGALRAKLERHGVMAVRNFASPPADGEAEDLGDHPDLRSWQFAFYTKDRNEVEAICGKRGMEPIWNSDGSLTVRSTTSAFATHPATGEVLYRNVIHVDPASGFSSALPDERRRRIERVISAQAMPTGYYLGDGSPLEPGNLLALHRLFGDLETAWPWQSGDVMVLDNLLTAHGRNPFSGPRDVQVGLLA